jgi:hypothetical protein
MLRPLKLYRDRYKFVGFCSSYLIMKGSVKFMQYSEFVDEYMLIYDRYMDYNNTFEERKVLEEQLIQLVRLRMSADLYHSSTLIS